MKIFTHASGRDQMLELQRDFRTLLRQAAFFEGVGKLVGFANAHQELRLRNKPVRLHTILFGGSGERSEIYVSSNVLLSGRFIGTPADRMLANRLQRSAMATR